MANAKLSDKCPVCMSWNWCGRECSRKPQITDSPEAANKLADELGGEPPATYQYRDPDKRRAYMREYMRKRRAGDN